MKRNEAGSKVDERNKLRLDMDIMDVWKLHKLESEIRVSIFQLLV